MSQRHSRAKAVGPVVEVRVERGHRSVFTLRPLAAGETILEFEGVVSAQPDRYSIQIGPDRHLLVGSDGDGPQGGLTRAWQFLNHSCVPNAFIRGRSLVAIDYIPSGTEVSFDYTTTEWDMASPFECRCGHAECLGLVRGYRWLTEGQRRARADRAGAYLRSDIRSSADASASGVQPALRTGPGHP